VISAAPVVPTAVCHVSHVCSMPSPRASQNSRLKRAYDAFQMPIPSSWPELAPLLASIGQQHIVDAYNAMPEAQQSVLLESLVSADAVTPGGLADYVLRGKVLIGNAAAGVSGVAGTPILAAGLNLPFPSAAWESAETLGLSLLGEACFVLVAGGLGERLGSKLSKVALSPTLFHSSCFLRGFASRILAFSRRAGTIVPWAIMTSNDTHDSIQQMLTESNYYGLPQEHVTLIKQEKVPCFEGIDGQLALESKNGSTVLQTKPHGHGDVHSLLYSSGLCSSWLRMGKNYVIFFQDTNALALQCVPALLGTASSERSAFQFVTIRRKPGEKVGAICAIESAGDSRPPCVQNVEYNELEPLLIAATGRGDIAESDGYSKFPGNINMFSISLKEYSECLELSKGVIPEFINPKFTADKKGLTSSARLECMMQALPLHDAFRRHKVSFVSFDRGSCFSPIKNNFQEAAAAKAKGIPMENAVSCEEDVYEMNRRWLAAAGAQIHPNPDTKLLPAVLLDPTFALAFVDVKLALQSAPDTSLEIGSNATLFIEGPVIFQGRNSISGSVHIRNCSRLPRHINSFESNPSSQPARFDAVEDHGGNEDVRLRGYALTVQEVPVEL
jgi:UDP-sugar pyrophosphorylase